MRVPTAELLRELHTAGAMRVDTLLSDPRHTTERRTFRTGHLLGPPVSSEELEQWRAAWPRHRLPQDLVALLGRANGIHLWADLDKGRAYEGLAPLAEWRVARQKMWGDHADPALLPNRYLALSYHADGAAFIVLDAESGRYFLMDAWARTSARRSDATSETCWTGCGLTGSDLEEDHVHDPLLGLLRRDDRFGWYESEPKPVRFLGGQACRFVFDDYGSDEAEHLEVRRAVQNALDAGPEILAAAEPYVVRYCEEMLVRYPDQFRPKVHLPRPSDVWSYVHFGSELHVSRRADGDAEDGVYLSIECNCDWEPEHGMQLVLRDGRTVSKVSAYDGHLTNADAFADPKLVGVIYVPMPPPRPRP